MLADKLLDFGGKVSRHRPAGPVTTNRDLRQELPVRGGRHEFGMMHRS
jgi:hypothetical protein